MPSPSRSAMPSAPRSRRRSGDLQASRRACRANPRRARRRRRRRRLPRERHAERPPARGRRDRDHRRDVPARPRGRAAAVRFRGRGRAVALRPAARGQRHRSQGRSRSRLECFARRAPRGHRATRRGPLPGDPGRRARRRPSVSCSSSKARWPRRRPSPSPGRSGELVARDALVELGFSLVEAEQALAQVDPELPAEERVREALRSAA